QQASDQTYKVDSSSSATRSEIALQNTPQSVSVVTQKVIEDIGIIVESIVVFTRFP
ncbi:hypothetical protein IAF30_20720, partial [Acinetobacter baumannii]|nr:hypothetical protein [Acinetobacter baumannii]